MGKKTYWVAHEINYDTAEKSFALFVRVDALFPPAAEICDVRMIEANSVYGAMRAYMQHHGCDMADKAAGRTA